MKYTNLLHEALEELYEVKFERDIVNGYDRLNREAAEELQHNHDEQLFWNYVYFEAIVNKDAGVEADTNIPIYFEPYALNEMFVQDLDRILYEASHGAKSLHRKHRTSNRKVKADKKRVHYNPAFDCQMTFDAKRADNHRVRHCEDIPSGKGGYRKGSPYIY